MKFRLVTTWLIVLFISGIGLSQTKSSRELAGIRGPVRTVRTEGRQLFALKYRQWGVMVYTTIYDYAGRVLERADYLPGGNPDTKATSAYDERGNEIEHAYYIHDDLSRRSTTRYDARNRKIEQLWFDGQGKQTSRTIFRYDRLGRQTAFEGRPNERMQKLNVTTFDRLGNELKRIEYSDNGAEKGRYRYSYDAAGNKTAEMHTYKQDGRTRSSKTTYVYNHRGDLIEEAQYFDGVLDNKKTYKRDAHGNETDMVETGEGQVKERESSSYEFDNDGNWTRVLITEWSSEVPDAPLQTTYEYRRIFSRVTDATIRLWSAAREGNTERVREMWRNGADLNAPHPDGGTSLIKAAARGYLDITKVLLSAGARIDQKDAEGWTALMWATEYGKKDVVQLLLTAGAHPNSKNGVGATPIMPAAVNGHIEVIKLLLDKGAEVNSAAEDGSTAFMAAAQHGQNETLRFLLTAGADATGKTNHGETALFFAASGGNTETVKTLLDAGLDVNAKDQNGLTPLMTAATHQPEVDVLKFLIDRGADIHAMTADGKTALSFAIQTHREEVVELLRKLGAK